MQYVNSVEEEREKGCIFCTKPASGDDGASFILHRGRTCFIMLNLYPYNTGHLMISPYRHVAELEELEDGEREELMDLTVLSVRVIKEVMRPQGFNLGMNLGKAAGAGYDQHLHMHVVPRWQGDTNFMPVLADAKVMPESLEENYRRLREGLSRMTGTPGEG